MNKTISKFNIPNFSRFVNPSIRSPKYDGKHRCVRWRLALKTASVFCPLHLIRHQFVTAKAFYPLLLMIYYFISSAYIINLKRLSSTLGEIIASITLILYALRCRRSADYLGINKYQLLKSSSIPTKPFLEYLAYIILKSRLNIKHHSVSVFVELPIVILMFVSLLLHCSFAFTQRQLFGS